MPMFAPLSRIAFPTAMPFDNVSHEYDKASTKRAVNMLVDAYNFVLASPFLPQAEIEAERARLLAEARYVEKLESGISPQADAKLVRALITAVPDYQREEAMRQVFSWIQSHAQIARCRIKTDAEKLAALNKRKAVTAPPPAVIAATRLRPSRPALNFGED